MIDKWLVNDINEVLGQQGRVVVTDAKVTVFNHLSKVMDWIRERIK